MLKANIPCTSLDMSLRCILQTRPPSSAMMHIIATSTMKISPENTTHIYKQITNRARHNSAHMKEALWQSTGRITLGAEHPRDVPWDCRLNEFRIRIIYHSSMYKPKRYKNKFKWKLSCSTHTNKF